LAVQAVFNTRLWQVPGRIVSEWNLKNRVLHSEFGSRRRSRWRWSTRGTLDGVSMRSECLESSLVGVEPESMGRIVSIV
jgi:hypothetical protein